MLSWSPGRQSWLHLLFPCSVPCTVVPWEQRRSQNLIFRGFTGGLSSVRNCKYTCSKDPPSQDEVVAFPGNTSRPETQGGIRGFTAIQSLLYAELSVAHVIQTHSNELRLFFLLQFSSVLYSNVNILYTRCYKHTEWSTPRKTGRLCQWPLAVFFHLRRTRVFFSKPDLNFGCLGYQLYSKKNHCVLLNILSFREHLCSFNPDLEIFSCKFWVKHNTPCHATT